MSDSSNAPTFEEIEQYQLDQLAQGRIVDNISATIDLISEPIIAGACHVCFGSGIVEDFDGERVCPVPHREPRPEDFD